MRILTIERASLGYGSKVVLKGVSFTVERGHFTAFLGPNGAGKTTILKAILGDLKPSTGSVNIAPRVRLGYVPQVDIQGSFWPLEVGDFLRLFTRTDGDRPLDCLDAVGIRHLADRNLQSLSGGERQKVLLAKALANSPDLLILDEPTQGMDVASEADYLDLLRKLNHEGTAIVLVTHLLHVVLSVADEVLVVEGGRTTASSVRQIVEEPVLEKIYGRPFEIGRVGSMPIVVPSTGKRYE
jgi:zinc transport system ATP-binding protein